MTGSVDADGRARPGWLVWRATPHRYLAVDGGSGADLLAALAERDPWLQPVASPRHADLLIVVEPISRALAPALLELARALPRPARVLVVNGAGADRVAQPGLVDTTDLFPGARRVAASVQKIHAAALDPAAWPPLTIGETLTVAPDTVALPLKRDRELATELAVLSLGPVQPFTAGPLRLVLICDGEQVLSAQLESGYARRGIAEAMRAADWPTAAGLAVLLRTLVVAFPDGLAGWPELIAVLAALTMTVGNLFALRQTSAKRLLAYSSIGQAGYLLVGVAAAGRDTLAVPGMLVYLAVYLFMNLGAFLAVDAIERQIGTDEIAQFNGLGRQLPWASAALALGLLSLAGFPPLGGFVGKTMLFGAALGAGWIWLAVVMGINVAISLFPYARVLEPLYLRAAIPVRADAAPAALRLALLALSVGTVASGVLPQPWVALASRATEMFLGAVAR